MIHFSINKRAEFTNIDQVRAACRERGGSAILYRNVWSLFAISESQPRLVHVHTYESRVLVGFRESLRTLWAGWWSLSGSLQTGMALAHNLSGGIDVTYLYCTDANERTPEGDRAFEAKYAIEARRIAIRSFIAAPMALVLLVALFFAWILYLGPAVSRSLGAPN
jgi:hypothetical protein